VCAGVWQPARAQHPPARDGCIPPGRFGMCEVCDQLLEVTETS
jgi:hypothetical protein